MYEYRNLHVNGNSCCKSRRIEKQGISNLFANCKNAINCSQVQFFDHMYILFTSNYYLKGNGLKY
jgi:hypothetical protein